LAGLTEGVDDEVFNVVDDGVPNSRQFLRLYKRNVKLFRSLYLPHALSYGLCWLWEAYADWSQEQLPRTYNRLRWRAFWKRARYSNEKLKHLVGWQPRIEPEEALERYFAACRVGAESA
jgi:nucleoside-diphosphate-sugar epimerase